MDLHLKDKVIIVTGGSSGVGEGITHLLADEGAIPVIVGRNRETIPQVVKDVENKGGKIFHVFTELTNPDDCKMAVDKIIDRFGFLDGLVNNAGVNDGVGLENGSYEKFITSINRNLTHYYLMAHHALPHLKKSKGAIVNIGSKTSVTGQGGTSGYASANGGRNALTREWACELLPYSIRVNAVIVAECLTPLYKRWLSTFSNADERLKSIEENIPFEKRMTTSLEIANTVAFLLSSRSSHTTGELLYVDGGYTHLDRCL